MAYSIKNGANSKHMCEQKAAFSTPSTFSINFYRDYRIDVLPQTVNNTVIMYSNFKRAVRFPLLAINGKAGAAFQHA